MTRRKIWTPKTKARLTKNSHRLKPIPKALRQKRRDPGTLRDSDFWETPKEALTAEFLELLMRRNLRLSFGEPCFGGGALVKHLTNRYHEAGGQAVCGHASELYMERWLGVEGYTQAGVDVRDAREFKAAWLQSDIDCFITNPPWRREHLFPIIFALRQVAPTWMLLPMDFMSRRNSASSMDYCSAVLPVGPINFNPEGGGSPYQCYGWYKFGRSYSDTILYRRWSSNVGMR